MSENKLPENKLQKKIPEAVREKTQYALAFGVIATMLFVAGFPLFVITFFGIFAYFLWKTFTQPSPNSVREVFEFYLSANETLRDDERRWFGFEIQEVIERGERILQTMEAAPPLVYFTLGALYHKAGNYKSAVNHLAFVSENEHSDESNYKFATPELKNYVRILRKIEREPAEAPQTSAAVRALERARRNRGKILLEESRKALAELDSKNHNVLVERNQQRGKFIEKKEENVFLLTVNDAERKNFAKNNEQVFGVLDALQAPGEANGAKENGNAGREQNQTDAFAQRKPISEVLRDIYDDK